MRSNPKSYALDPMAGPQWPSDDQYQGISQSERQIAYTHRNPASQEKSFWQRSAQS